MDFGDKIIVKIDAWFRSGCGRLSQNVSNLDNAFAHLANGGFIGMFACLSLLVHVQELWGYIIGGISGVLALIIALYPPIEEWRGYPGGWRRLYAFIKTASELVPESEIAKRKTSGILDGFADLWWKSFDGFRALLVPAILHILFWRGIIKC